MNVLARTINSIDEFVLFLNTHIFKIAVSTRREDHDHEEDEEKKNLNPTSAKVTLNSYTHYDLVPTWMLVIFF